MSYFLPEFLPPTKKKCMEEPLAIMRRVRLLRRKRPGERNDGAAMAASLGGAVPGSWGPAKYAASAPKQICYPFGPPLSVGGERNEESAAP